MKTTNEAYEAYKRLTPDQREYEQFAKIHEMYSKVCEMEDRYASKWVEQVVRVMLGMIVIAFFSVLIKIVLGDTAEIIALLMW